MNSLDSPTFDPQQTETPPAAGVPVRYRRGPLLGLVVMALVPLAALTALLVWSDAQADEYEAAERAEDIEPEPVDAAADPMPALTTVMATYRRVPDTLASLGADNELAIAMEQLAAFVNDGSCLAVSVNGRAVSSWNGDVPVIPASTNKLLVAGAAIEVLGADHRFTTSLAASPAVDGVVDGDVYLVGGGDPLLVASGIDLGDDAPDPAATTLLDALADAVVEAGITSIRGAVVGDATRYDDQYVNPTWGSGVAFVEAGPIAGLVVNDGRTVGRSGRQRDPGEAAAREFVRLLRERNITVSDGWESGITTPDTPVLATVDSAPLSAIVADMLTRSDNDTAEMLVKELGLVEAGAGTTPAGLEVLDARVTGWGVPMVEAVLADGSGLSANNRLTCDTLVEVLDHLADTPAVAGLAVAGRSGTLIDEFLGTDVEGQLIAKTGTLTNPPADADPPEVKALAGYLRAANGDVIEFALVLNGPGFVTTDGYVGYWSALAERLAAHPTGPDTALLGPR
jgi:D-alanyl-D-alanine carboxypeptidase/D-alanyl-D-alanine-endopeptidase (penicillin-binding protein 4)